MKFVKLRHVVTAIVALASLATAHQAVAQEILKHPRVVELEDRLNKDAAAFIKARFPEIPFLVNISIDPMRRDVPNSSGSASGNEYLPYFDADSDEEIRDEWDNPQVPLMALLNRIKRAKVSISIPSKLKEADVNEMKEGIFKALHLTPARDVVDIARRDWVVDEVPWFAIYAATSAIFLLLIGLLAINRSSANRIARALTDMKLQNNNSSASSPGPAPMMQMPDSDKTSRQSQSQEVKFNDPIKMKELATRHIEFLTRSAKFPTHHDVFVLDRLGIASPAKLGAILTEFPAEMQKRIFAYSSGFHWIEALNEPGFLDFECLEVLQSMTQTMREGDSLDWDQTVLSVWRLGEARTHFVRTLPKEEAFALLAEMPKAVAVSEARKSFPGAWAPVLDPNFVPLKITQKRTKDIHEAATRQLGLNDLEMVKRYRAEKELLDYLETADPVEERDIYGAAPADSIIHRLRAPFFPIFDQEEETIREFVPKISTEQWALALFNLLKSERAKIDMHFSEKQRFLMIERFKRFDAHPPDRALIGKARAGIGKALRQFNVEQIVAKNVINVEEKLAAGQKHEDSKAA